tara:strand:+ start:440 stop:916 length:477 start_codon:yes stop_codon:yes gene_type:complete
MSNKINNKKPKIARKRHIAKTISWRIIGTVDTWIISYILVYYFGERQESATEAATFIAVFELVTKTILYYFHERIWYKLNFVASRQRIRHLIKTISWRLIGAIDTIALVYIVYFILFGNTDGASEVAISIFSIEIITKMFLYYIHERIWFKFNWGVIK